MGKMIEDRPIDSQKGILHHAEGVALMPANTELSGMEVSLVNALAASHLFESRFLTDTKFKNAF
jgi:chromosome partitioning protein